MNARRTKVLIVDDSAVVRQVIAQALQGEPDIFVMGAAPDPLFAMTRMKADWPDVILLDVEMPRMDGISFLRQIMAEHPTPVIICSSLAERGSRVAFDALAAGAFTVITKPKQGLKGFLEDSANDIRRAVRSAAKANLRALTGVMPSTAPKLSADVILAAGTASVALKTTERLVALGTSTGGTQALEAVLTRLPRTCPGLVVVQHMPEKFTGMFSQRLDGLCQVEVKEAQHGDRVGAGRVLIAPGGRHMMLRRSGAQYFVDVVDGPVVNRHKPSVDVLFRSVAKFAGGNALGIIMTGMGDDGARGLKEMRDAGASTIAQDEASCVVFGMPREAIRLEAAGKVMSLANIPQAIMQFGNGS